ncbi:MAG: histidine kinase [Saprospiraceae bacterium]
MKYFFILWCLPLFGLAQSYPIRHYTTSDGLTSNIVYDALQDKAGYMWFATNTGISIFDGRLWKNYTVNDGLADNEILKIRRDPKDRIWLFCFNGSLNVMEGNKMLSIKNSPLLKKLGYGQFYRTFYANDHDSIWVYNNSNNPSLIRWPDHVQVLPNKNHITVFQHKKGRVTLNRNHIYHLPEYGTKSSRLSEFLFNSWTQTETGSLMAFDGKQVLKIDSSGNHKLVALDSLPMRTVIDFYSKDEKSLWLAVDKKGVYHYELTKGVYVLKEKLLQDNYITSTTIDSEGNHWFTSYGSGIFMLPRNFESTQHYSEKNGLYESNTFAVCVDPGGQIWAGHKYEFMDVISKNKAHHFQLTKDNVSVGRVGKIRNHPGGSMLISSDEGFFVYNPNSDQRIQKVFLEMPGNKLLKLQPIKDFAVDSKGNIYIASQENIHVLHKTSLEEKNLIARRLEMPSKRIFSLALNEADQLWISTIDGIVKVEDHRVHPLSSLSAAFSNRIEQMAVVGEDLLVSVMGYGILVIHNEKIASRITTEHGLLSNHCTRFFVHKRDLYVCSNKGLNKVYKNSDNKWTVTQPNTVMMNSPQQINDVFVNDNRIYLASLTGIHVFDHAAANQFSGKAPKLYLTEILYKGKQMKLDDALVLKYNDRHVTFSFSAPTFSLPEVLQFQYKINSSPWLSLAFPQLELNALVPGDYTLQVRVRHPKGSWSKALIHRFEVERPFYLSWWFYTLLGSSVLVWFYFNYRRKIKKLKSEQQTKLNYEQEINRLQLKSLQAMINPHFIFNSLSAIQQEIHGGDAKKANNYLTRFSRLLRKNLENINESFITLDEEIEILSLYLETEKMRMDDKLDFKITVDSKLDIHNTWIPTMLLQPIVENAIWHGIAADEGKGLLEVDFQTSGQLITITITDNGIGYNKSQTLKRAASLKGKSLGMQITKDRLRFLEQKTGAPISFSIVDRETENEKGTRVTISMSADM